MGKKIGRGLLMLMGYLVFVGIGVYLMTKSQLARDIVSYSALASLVWLVAMIIYLPINVLYQEAKRECEE
jgi:hypothetical protein